jgi:hypothetical protein
MAMYQRESLVQRDVSVLCGGQAVDSRLGSYEAKRINPATPISTRHPSHGCPTVMPETNGRHHPDASWAGDSAVLWAGRLNRAGVLDRRSPAKNAGRTNVQRWSDVVGGSRFAAAVRLCPLGTKHTASVADLTLRRSSPLHAIAFQCLGAERGQQEPSAGFAGTMTRTPPAASTRGTGVR